MEMYEKYDKETLMKMLFDTTHELKLLYYHSALEMCTRQDLPPKYRDKKCERARKRVIKNGFDI